MLRPRRRVRHFVTGATVGWLPIFTTTARCDVLMPAFQYCRAHKALKLHAWVVLDTHFHAIVAAPNLTRVLADLNETPRGASGAIAGATVRLAAISADFIKPRVSIRSGRRDRTRR